MVDLEDSEFMFDWLTNSKMAGLAGFADFGETLDFICKTLKAKRLSSSCYGNR